MQRTREKGKEVKKSQDTQGFSSNKISKEQQFNMTMGRGAMGLNQLSQIIAEVEIEAGGGGTAMGFTTGGDELFADDNGLSPFGAN